MVDVVTTVLHQLTPLSEQASILADFRRKVTTHYKNNQIPVFDSFEETEKAELASSISLVLALLRELHPCYYDMEHLHCLVE